MNQFQINDVKIMISRVFDENFYDLVVLNSDESMLGRKSIESKILIPRLKEYIEINFISGLSLTEAIFEKYGQIRFLESFAQTMEKMEAVIATVDSVDRNQQSSETYESNFRSFLSTYINFVNETKKMNITIDQVVDHEQTYNDLKISLRKKWDKAFQQNYDQSHKSDYLTFRNNIVENPFLETMKYLNF